MQGGVSDAATIEEEREQEETTSTECVDCGPAEETSADVEITADTADMNPLAAAIEASSWTREEIELTLTALNTMIFLGVLVMTWRDA
jgi:hypothetical protein